MLRAQFKSNYRSAKGNTVFVYTVTGSATELAAYKTAKGDFYRKSDTDVPLLYTTSYNGDNLNLIITQNNKVVADNSSTEKMNAIVNQHRGIMQAELAKLAAAAIFGKLTGSAAPAITAPAVETPAIETPATEVPATEALAEVEGADLPA